MYVVLISETSMTEERTIRRNDVAFAFDDVVVDRSLVGRSSGRLSFAAESRLLTDASMYAALAVIGSVFRVRRHTHSTPALLIEALRRAAVRVNAWASTGLWSICLRAAQP